MNKEQVIKSMHERMKRNIDDFFKPSTFEDTRKALLAKRAKWQEVWNVSKGGDLCNKENGYLITSEQLAKKNWFLHLADKVWFDANTFIPAYFEACRRAGIKEILLNV